MAKAKKKKPTKKKPAKKKPAKKKPAKKKPAKKKPAFPWLDLYLVNVAANVKFGLERSMDTCLNMFLYEFPKDLKKLRAEAQRIIDGGKLEEVAALGKAKKLPELDVAAMLNAILDESQDHFASAEE